MTLVFLLAAGLTTCAGAGEKPRTKVLLIGIDAGEWSVLGPLLDQGRVPNYAWLRDHGASGKLRSLEPLTKSPIIWASIATGKVPSKHGVSGFFTKQRQKQRAAARDSAKTASAPAGGDATRAEDATDEAPTTSNLWRARPIWDILGSLGMKVGVVGWWTTWPAQPVNGVLISDYVQFGETGWAGKQSHRTYPESLDSLVVALRKTPESVSWAEIFQFVPPFDTTKSTARQEKLVHDLKWIYASDLTFYRIALHLYQSEHPDFFTVYFRGVDEISHIYWDIDIPDQFNPPLTDDEYQWLKVLIPNYYVFTDKMIGQLMKVAGPKTDVMVCSDHGFMGGGKGIMAHKLDGMIFMEGPGVKKDADISGATVLDITPTILALYGLPTAQDMDGRPIEDALESSVMRRISHDKKLATYETAPPGGQNQEPLGSPVDQELRERLRSLGYIQ